MENAMKLTELVKHYNNLVHIVIQHLGDDIEKKEDDEFYTFTNVQNQLCLQNEYKNPFIVGCTIIDGHLVLISSHDVAVFDADYGTKIRANRTFDVNGMQHDKDKCKKYLTPGQIYTVLYAEDGGWSSTVQLKEVDGVNFNTVMFNECIMHATEYGYAWSPTLLKGMYYDEEFGFDVYVTNLDYADVSIIMQVQPERKEIKKTNTEIANETLTLANNYNHGISEFVRESMRICATALLESSKK